MCEISRKNSKWLLRKWQTTLGDTFFCRTLYISKAYKLLNNIYGTDWPKCQATERRVVEVISRTRNQSAEISDKNNFNIGAMKNVDLSFFKFCGLFGSKMHYFWHLSAEIGIVTGGIRSTPSTRRASTCLDTGMMHTLSFDVSFPENPANIRTSPLVDCQQEAQLPLRNRASFLCS